MQDVTEQNPLAKLGAALAAAQQDSLGVVKDATNQHNRYNYASAETIMKEATRILGKHGLSVLPISAKQVLDDDYPNVATTMPNQQLDTFAIRYKLVREALLIHSSGESMTITWEFPIVPRKGTPVDKAAAAAMTSGLSYLLRDLLLLPRVDHADDISGRHEDDNQGRQDQHRNATGDRRSERPRQEPSAPASSLTIQESDKFSEGHVGKSPLKSETWQVWFCSYVCDLLASGSKPEGREKELAHAVWVPTRDRLRTILSGVEKDPEINWKQACEDAKVSVQPAAEMDLQQLLPIWFSIYPDAHPDYTAEAPKIDESWQKALHTLGKAKTLSIYDADYFISRCGLDDKVYERLDAGEDSGDVVDPVLLEAAFAELSFWSEYGTPSAKAPAMRRDLYLYLADFPTVEERDKALDKLTKGKAGTVRLKDGAYYDKIGEASSGQLEKLMGNLKGEAVTR